MCSLLCNRMKSLETDAVHAQAVIAKAQEMSRGVPNPNSSSSAVNIAFAGQLSGVTFRLQQMTPCSLIRGASVPAVS